MWGTQAVGETAGLVWRFLHEHGKSSLTIIEREVEAPKKLVHMAIGWLAREGKLELSQEGRAIQLWLTER